MYSWVILIDTGWDTPMLYVANADYRAFDFFKAEIGRMPPEDVVELFGTLDLPEDSKALYDRYRALPADARRGWDVKILAAERV